MDYLEIGTAPTEEDCAQVGSPDYHEKAREEIVRFKDLLIEKFGEPPFGISFKTVSVPHDFGNYLELRVYFQENEEDAVNYAFACESHGPRTWDDTEPFDWRNK